jgi:hypothetical protein
MEEKRPVGSALSPNVPAQAREPSDLKAHMLSPPADATWAKAAAGASC